jgi:hypothetical protein
MLLPDKYTILPSVGEGHCLLEAVGKAMFLPTDLLRTKLCEFYFNFDFDKAYGRGSLEQRFVSVHRQAASSTTTDIVAFALALERPFYLYYLIGNDYTFMSFSSMAFDDIDPVAIAYGNGKFEAVVPKVIASKPNQSKTRRSKQDAKPTRKCTVRKCNL